MGLIGFGVAARLLSVVLVIGGAVIPVSAADDAIPLVRVMLSDTKSFGVVTGRILVKAQDGGLLLEDRTGRLHNLTPGEIARQEVTEQPWVPLSTEEHAAWLQQQFGDSFAIRQTDHFLLCTASSDVFADYCAELLEVVYGRYFEFFDGSPVQISEPNILLPVIIFQRQQDLARHAAQEHPQVPVTNVPGYYSSTSNQMYVCQPAGRSTSSRRILLSRLRRKRRHVETVVHEAVHLLGFNTGLHVRQADQPLWFREGFAAWFEASNGRQLLWAEPGEPNSTWLRVLRKRRSGLPMPPESLIQNDQVFLDAKSIPSAYASSWALVNYLVRRDRAAFDRIAVSYQQRGRLQVHGPQQELETFRESVQSGVREIEAAASAEARRPRRR